MSVCRCTKMRQGAGGSNAPLREAARRVGTKRSAALAAALLFLSFTGTDDARGADGDPYPSRPIRLVIGFSGGTIDTLARIVADRLEPALGQPVIVEAKTGASGNIAAEFVARAAPDGYTLLMASTATTVLPALHEPRAVDPLKAFTPVSKLITQPAVIIAHPSLGVVTLDQLLVHARSRPGELAYASSDIGATPHLAAALLWTRANVELLHVPYVNPGQVMKDLVAGEVKIGTVLSATAAPFVHSGHVRALAITGAHRISSLPDVPTIAESGFAGFDLVSWYGIVAPAGTPRAIVDRLQAAIAGVLKLPDVRERLAALGSEAVGNSPDQFAAHIRAEVARWPDIVRAAGIPGSR